MLYIIFRKIRNIYYKRKFYKVGDGFFAHGNFSLKNGEKVELGNNVSINDGVYINGQGGISIGDDVSISAKVIIVSTGLDTNEFASKKRHVDKKIIIGNNVHLGAGAIINPGITIGDNVIIGSGSVVTKNISSRCIAVGNYAKKIKEF
ncbi:hypothetical protein BCT73_06555 [Vibrio breoganii]|uniref:acyltransferase n=1 Tax=Vibrio breoganii TaxID=553239 RepID=UPI000C81ED60|nr:acyltransferase [Vibrio breoganii]PML61246.1 hypothetical protein BCT73_06555 [Vibrio breoganii]